MIDITFDLETCALSPNAAVMSMAAVVWDRNGEDTPFYTDEDRLKYPTYSAHVDLRSMFIDGFDFDKRTAEWWGSQSDEAKANVLAADNYDEPCLPIKDVVENFFSWVSAVEKSMQSSDVNLWCQGSDFDIAILRNICNKYHIDLPIKHNHFRDHRTFYMEGAKTLCDIAGVEFDPKRAYAMVDDYEGDGVKHDPTFDCQRSIASTWQMMKHLRSLKIEKE